MNDKLSEQQTSAILKALDDALDQGPWEDSNFLKAIGKNLRKIRDDFVAELNAPSPLEVKRSEQVAHRMALHGGQIKVFVSLYSSDGTNLQSWERILMNLPRQMISRPIYESEEDVKALIRIKENKDNEAYVSIYVNQSDILPVSPDKVPVDKLGRPLLLLKDRSLQLENIDHFIHKVTCYEYARGRLTEVIPSDSE